MLINKAEEPLQQRENTAPRKSMMTLQRRARRVRKAKCPSQFAAPSSCTCSAPGSNAAVVGPTSDTRTTKIPTTNGSKSPLGRLKVGSACDSALKLCASLESISKEYGEERSVSEDKIFLMRYPPFDHRCPKMLSCALVFVLHPA